MNKRHARDAAICKKYGLKFVQELIAFAKRWGISPSDLLAASTPLAAHQLVANYLGVSCEWPRRLIETLGGVMVIDFWRIQHITVKFSEHRERYALRILLTIMYPDEIWRVLHVHPVTGKSEFRMRYIKFFKDAPHGLAVASIDESSGEQTLFNFMPISRARGMIKQRRGVLVYSAEKAKERRDKE